MNILFFLTPKSEVAYIPADESLRQAFEKLKYHGWNIGVMEAEVV